MSDALAQVFESRVSDAENETGEANSFRECQQRQQYPVSKGSMPMGPAGVSSAHFWHSRKLGLAHTTVWRPQWPSPSRAPPRFWPWFDFAIFFVFALFQDLGLWLPGHL